MRTRSSIAGLPVLSLLGAIVVLGSADAEARICDYNEGDLYTGCSITINIPYCDRPGTAPQTCDAYSYYTESTPGPDGESDYVVRQEDNTLTIAEYRAQNPTSVGTGSVTRQEPESLFRTGTMFDEDIPDGVDGMDRWGVWATDGVGLFVSVVFNDDIRRWTDSWLDWDVLTEASPASSIPAAHRHFDLAWSGRIQVRHEIEENARSVRHGDIGLSLTDEDGAFMLSIESSFPNNAVLSEAYSVSGVPVTEEGFEGSGVSGHFYGDNHEIAAGVIEVERGTGLFATTRDAN